MIPGDGNTDSGLSATVLLIKRAANSLVRKCKIAQGLEILPPTWEIQMVHLAQIS